MVERYEFITKRCNHIVVMMFTFTKVVQQCVGYLFICWPLVDMPLSIRCMIVVELLLSMYGVCMHKERVNIKIENTRRSYAYVCVRTRSPS